MIPILLVRSLPFLASNAMIGWMLGYSTANSEKNHHKIQSLASDNKKLFEKVQYLREELQNIKKQEAIMNAKEEQPVYPQKPVKSPTKVSLLKHLLESNLKLRKK
jgi:hypothetical protein